MNEGLRVIYYSYFMVPLSSPAKETSSHGPFADGSGWEDVGNILKKGGYKVSVVHGPRCPNLSGNIARNDFPKVNKRRRVR
jgi:hypothetical protein